MLRAPAKLNMGLRVLGVRPDGYHRIESLFVPVELWDDLEVEIRPGASRIEIEVSVDRAAGLSPELARVPAGADNLASRAAAAYCRAYDVEGRIRLRLHKRLPAAAGLGGGSSDAGAVLTALARLTGRPMQRAALQEIASGLGADVPFFLSPEPAIVSGIGEQIDPVEGLPPLEIVVANPGLSLATAEVYRAADALGSALTPARPGSTMRALERLVGAGSPFKSEEWKKALGDLLINDLEPAARRLCPPIGRLADRMREAGAVAVVMTGSGATIFAIFATRQEAVRTAALLRASNAGRPGGTGTADERAGGAERGGTDGVWAHATRVTGQPFAG